MKATGPNPNSSPCTTIPAMLSPSQAPHILTRLQELEQKGVQSHEVTAYVAELDHLLSQTYQIVSELDCQTRTQPENEAARKAYRTFLAESYPPIDAAYQTALAQALVYFDQLPEGWQPAFESQRSQAPDTLAVAELKGEILKEASQYQDILGRFTGSLAGRRSDLQSRLRSEERGTRYQAYLELQKAEAEQRQAYEDLFVALHRKRQRLAELGGHANYYEFYQASPEARARSLSSDELRRVRQDVMALLRPVLQQVRQLKAAQLRLPDLRPWDSQVTAGGTAVMSTAHDVNDLLDAVGEMLRCESPEMQAAFGRLRDSGNLYIATDTDRPRAPYTFLLAEEGLAWMTVTFTGQASSVFQTLHEIGHCLHYTLMPADSLLAQRQPPREYREFAAHSLEQLCLNHLGRFFAKGDQAEAACLLLEKALRAIYSACLLDELQEELYCQTTLEPGDVTTAYQRLLLMYPAGINLEGLLEQQGAEWASWQFFSAPFYGMEYALAWLAALTRGAVPEQDPLRIYTQRFDRPLAEMFAAAGVPLLPSTAQIQVVAQQLARLLIK